LTRNLTVRIVCVLLALVLWAQAASQQEMEKVVELPLQLTGLPDSLAIRRSKIPSSVWIRLRNSKLRFLLHDLFGRDRGRVRVGLEGVGEGEFHHDISVREVDADGSPMGIESPTTLHLRIYPRRTRMVTVRVVLDGRLDEGLVLSGRPAVTPAKVQVDGPAPLIDSLDHINTKPLKVSHRAHSFRETVDLESPDPDLRLMPKEVDISLSIDEIIERSFNNIPISVLSDVQDSTRIVVQPELAQVRLTGPARVVNALRPQDISVVLHVEGDGGGVYQVKPEVLLPESVLSSQVDPPTFQVIVGGGRGRR